MKQIKMAETIETTRTIFGGWEAQFVADRREKRLLYLWYAVQIACVAIGLAAIIIHGK